MNNKIRVFVRCRPIRGTENRSNINIDEDHGQIIVNDTRSFQFDDVFSENSKQIDVYMLVVSPLVHDLILGYNCTVFAYGPTGTGKTFTMEGEKIDESSSSWDADSLSGIIPRTINQLFETLEKKSPDYHEVKVSFLELYNEEAYDLLSPIDDMRKLKIYDNGPKQIVDGLQHVSVKDRDDLHKILLQGSSKRATAATQLNARSSRSHTIFSITATTNEGKTGVMNLIDLAGSENIGRSKAQDIRAREAGSINQSLLTLGRVIKALVDKAPHVPYRESKLTRLLQNSLGGTTKTSLIATISPSNGDMEDTINTLEYATRAKGVTNKVIVNQSMLSVSTSQANEIIESLKQQLIDKEYRIRNEVAKEYRKESDKVRQYFEERYNDAMEDFNQKRQESRTEINKLKHELKEKIEEINRLTEECHRSKTLEKDLQEARVENDKLKYRIEEFDRKFNNDDNELRISLQKSKDEAELLKQKLQDTRVNENKLTEVIRKLSDELETIKQELSSTQGDDKKVEDEMNQLRDENKEHKQALLNMAEENKKLKDEIRKMNVEAKKPKHNLQETLSQNDKLKEQIDELEDENERMKQELDEANFEIDRLKDQIEIVGNTQTQECSPITTPKIGARKSTKVKKNLLDVSADYANVTFNNEDEIAQVDLTRSKKIIACSKKREINQAITMSGKKRRLQAADDQVEISPVCKRVTRSRKKLF